MDKLPSPKERNLYLAKQVNQDSINSVTKSIIEIQENDEYLKKLYAIHDLNYKPMPIKLYIDSYGGMIYQCRGLIGVMQSSTTDVHTYVTGAAMSAGFLITICGKKRFAYKHATLMYHQLSSMKIGELKHIEDSVEQSKKIQQWAEDLVIDCTEIPRAKLKEVYDRKEDWYLTAAEAKNLNVIDEIL